MFCRHCTSIHHECIMVTCKLDKFAGPCISTSQNKPIKPIPIFHVSGFVFLQIYIILSRIYASLYNPRNCLSKGYCTLQHFTNKVPNILWSKEKSYPEAFRTILKQKYFIKGFIELWFFIYCRWVDRYQVKLWTIKNCFSPNVPGWHESQS